MPLLLITNAPAPGMPALPLLFSVFVDDRASTIRSLRDAGRPTPVSGAFCRRSLEAW